MKELGLSYTETMPIARSGSAKYEQKKRNRLHMRIREQARNLDEVDDIFYDNSGLPYANVMIRAQFGKYNGNEIKAPGNRTSVRNMT